MATCHDREGWRPVSNQRIFDSTPCFEEGIVIPTTQVILLISAFWRASFLSVLETRSSSIKSLWVLRAKLFCLAIAFFASTANLVQLFYWRTSVPVLLPYILEPLVLAVSFPLTILNHRRTRTSSSILLLFWPTYAIGFFVWARTIVSNDLWNLRSMIILKGAVVLFGLFSFTLELLAPEDKDDVGIESKSHQENPILTSNLFTRWTFSWMTPLMRKGAAQYIVEQDLPPLLPGDDCANLGRVLQAALRKRMPLWMALFMSYGTPFLAAAGVKLVQDGLAFLQPQFLRLLLSYISSYRSAHEGFGKSPDKSYTEGIMLVAFMLLSSTFQTILINQYFQRCFETGMRVRAGLITAIYEKALMLSNDERGGRATGDIVNLMSVDVSRLQEFCHNGLMAVSGPFQIILAFVSLYKLLGWSAFVGVAILIMSIPLNTLIIRTLKKMQRQQMKNRDRRTRIIGELLATIRSIKLHGWEKVFIDRVLYVRNELEMKMLKRIGIVTSLNGAIWSGVPLLVALSSLVVAALASPKPLTSDIIFPSISVFMLLQAPLAMFAQVVSNITQAIVSIQRLSAFLNASELQPGARQIVDTHNLQLGDEEQVLSITNGEFSWSQQDTIPTLEGINITLRKSELLGILGPVGSGKSSLLSAIVGEMTHRDGAVILSGCISYAPQTPWIMSASVRDNILFSHEYDEDFYNLVVDACALGPDINMLSQGDLTQVGERGITLSGGQRARLSLARAVYARADLIILDDVLAAVDSHVAKHVFDNVIGPKGLLSTKARILVTNSISFIRQFDQLVFIRRGIILENGSPEALMSNTQSEIYKLISGHGSSSSNFSGISTPFIASGSVTPQDDVNRSVTSLSQKSRQQSSFHKAILATAPLSHPFTNEITKEHSEKGQVKTDVYWQYIEAASKTGFFLFLFANVAQYAMNVLGNLTLRIWSERNRVAGRNMDAMGWLFIYAIFSAAQIFFAAAAGILIWVYCGLRSARRLHDSMLNTIMLAPLSFFETTPTGRILNLFSRDTNVVDETLARIIQSVARNATACVSIVVVIGFSFPLFLLAVVPLGWFYRSVMIYYLATSRELKRLDAVSRSPIIAWFSETLAGLSTIRAFQHQPVFASQNEFRVDRSQICYWSSFTLNRWLSVRLEIASGSILFIAAVLSLVALFTTGVDAGLVGLVLSYALNTTSSLNWVVRSASGLEQNIVSVERILHYSSKDMFLEAPHELPHSRPAQPWPSQGEVEFRHYSTRYRPGLDLVLADLSMKIQPKEKIGICGRTGAGKSSILLGLFRIIEPASGTILIDGVDITKVGLHDLRSSISIVPQSPDLFEGSFRTNIDPLGEYQDADIWIALGQARLKEYVEHLPQGLDTSVWEGGSSLSVGQKQLLCFARALLRKSSILVLDEATSAVDLDTDKAIQEIIHGPVFANVTMLTVAHRLNTIMKSDRVLVLEAGKIMELDSPITLLSNKHSMFYSLAEEAGLVKGYEEDLFLT